MYDLNVVWPSPSNPSAISVLKKELVLLSEFGYRCVALNYIVTGKLKGAVSPFSEETLADLAKAAPKLKLLRRVTLVLDEAAQNQNFASFVNQFDLVCVQPQSEKSLQSAASALDIDMISLDITKRLPFYLKHKLACSAVDRGVRFELKYSPALTNAEARRHCITNAAAIIRATRGRGIVVTSGCTSPASLRAPFDVINLVTVWGLESGRSRESIDKTARAAALNGILRLDGAKQAIVPEDRPAKKPRLGA